MGPGSLGIRVTAEGVETAEQAQTLRAFGCHFLQGYYFSRPVSVEAFTALLDRPPWQTGP